jgi:hypothetical protein
MVIGPNGCGDPAANGEGDHNFSGGADGPSRDGAFRDHRRRRDFSRLLNSEAMNDPVRNDLPLLVVSMWQVRAEDKSHYIKAAADEMR